MSRETSKRSTERVKSVVDGTGEKSIRGFLKWIGTVILSGVVLPIILIWAKETIFDRPEFQARIEYGEVHKGLLEYRVIIKNTGWRSAPGLNGQVSIEFEGKIEDFRHRLPHQSIFKNKEGKEIDTCKGETFCGIYWGEIGSGGEIKIEFRPEGPLSLFPSAAYRMVTIKNWSCSELPPNFKANCTKNELSPK